MHSIKTPLRKVKSRTSSRPVSKHASSSRTTASHSTRCRVKASPRRIISRQFSSDMALSPDVMNHLTIEQYNQKRIQNELPYGSQIIVQGWLRSIRHQGQVTFLSLNDGSNVAGIQAVFDPQWTPTEIFQQLTQNNIPLGSAIRLRGEMTRNERQPHESASGWELRASGFDIEGICDVHGYIPKAKVEQPVDEDAENDALAHLDKKERKKLKKAQKEAAAEAARLAANTMQYTPSQLPGIESYSLEPYPMQKKFQTLDFLRQHPDTRLRTNTYAALQRIRSSSILALHNHFANDGFVCIQTPVITPSDCEGGGDLFTVSTPKTEQSLAEQQQQQQQRAPSVPSPVVEDLTMAKKNAHFFSRPAFLSVSGQLYAEIAASSLRRVYSFGPTFRAENSHTSRHLAEFWMLEPEMAFATLPEVCTACEASIQNAIITLLKNPSSRSDLEFFQSRGESNLIERLERISSTPFGRITYTDALTLLKEHVTEGKVTFEHTNFDWGCDLQTEHEKYLAGLYQRPVFVTNYPAAIKAFYMKLDDDSITNAETAVTHRNKSISTNMDAWVAYGTSAEQQQQHTILPLPSLTEQETNRMTVACFDLLVPGMGELCGGSQREERLEVLLQRVKQHNLPLAEYQWYLDLRRFGTTQHGGWGMGFERFLAYITGTDNVRDTMLIPRAPGLMQI